MNPKVRVKNDHCQYIDFKSKVKIEHVFKQILSADDFLGNTPGLVMSSHCTAAKITNSNILLSLCHLLWTQLTHSPTHA